MSLTPEKKKKVSHEFKKKKIVQYNTHKGSCTNLQIFQIFVIFVFFFFFRPCFLRKKKNIFFHFFIFYFFHFFDPVTSSDDKSFNVLTPTPQEISVDFRLLLW